MPATGLQITLQELREEVQRFMGYGRKTVFSTMSSNFQGDVTSIINRGLRQFYFPQPLPGESTSHQWSFLRERRVFNFPAPVTTTTTCTCLDGVATFAAPTIDRSYRHTVVKFTNTDGYFPVKSTTGTQVVTLWDPTVTFATASTATFWWNRAEFFGSGVSVNLSYPPATNRGPLKNTNSGTIANMEQNEYVSPIGLPSLFCVEPASWPQTAETTEQDFHLRVYPWAQEKLTLYADIKFDIGASGLGSVDSYPLGGSEHYETVIVSCLAVAEEFGDTPSSKYRELFTQRLASSVMLDRAGMYPSIFGYNGDRSDSIGRLDDRDVTVTYIGPASP
jgi:hypothetical protein